MKKLSRFFLGSIIIVFAVWSYFFYFPQTVGEFTACDPSVKGIIFKNGHGPHWMNPGVHLKLKIADSGDVVFQQTDIVDYVMGEDISRFYCAGNILFNEWGRTFYFDTLKKEKLLYVSEVRFPTQRIGQVEARVKDANPEYKGISLEPIEIEWESGFSNDGWHVN